MKKTNIEIEFKTAIGEKTYYDMLQLFDLESNVFKQTNYYFDTDNFDLNKQHIVLRIRQKGNNHFKVTSKKQTRESGNEAFESHVLLQKNEVQDMIENGFNTKKYFDDIDYFVTFKASLDNYRVSTYFEEGLLFFDKSVYHGITDYEIEYEHNDEVIGKKIFDNFLKEHNITFTAARRKSERALKIK